MNRTSITNVMYTFPALLVYSFFVIVPMLMTLYYSFYDWDGLSLTKSFIGIRNYMDALKDAQFKSTIFATFFFTIVVTVVSNIAALFFAVLLNKKSRMTNFYRTVFFFPTILSIVVVGFIWQTILTYNGIFNSILEKLHIEPIEFFSDRITALLSLCGIAIWSGVGFGIVIYLAGLQTISSEYYEAATIDGASKWQLFRHITFPLLAASVTLNVVLGAINGLKEFSLVTVVTDGGPAEQTRTMAMHVIKEAGEYAHFSYGAALGIWLFLIIAVLSIILTMFFRRREEVANG